MTVQQLIEELQQLAHKDAKIIISVDPDFTECREIDSLNMMQISKSNNDGTYDAYVIVPSEAIITDDLFDLR